MALDFDDIRPIDLKELTKTASLEGWSRASGRLPRKHPGGRHWLWRCSQVRGNEKLASRPTRQDDSFTGHKTLIGQEAKGLRRRVSSTGHRRRQPPMNGSALFRTIVKSAQTGDATAAVRTLESGPLPQRAGDYILCSTERPGDRFNRETKAGDLLSKHGWTYLCSRNGTDYWRRRKTEGLSATTNHNGHNAAWVFSTSRAPVGSILGPFALLRFWSIVETSRQRQGRSQTLCQAQSKQEGRLDEDLRGSRSSITPGVTPEKIPHYLRAGRVAQLSESGKRAEGGTHRIFSGEVRTSTQRSAKWQMPSEGSKVALQTQYRTPSPIREGRARNLAGQPSGKVVRVMLMAGAWRTELSCISAH